MDFRRPRSGRQAAAFALYLPLLGALGYLTAVAGWHLRRGNPAGALGVGSAIALGLLCRRTLRIGHGEIDDVDLDLALAAAADVLLAAAFLLAR